MGTDKNNPNMKLLIPLTTWALISGSSSFHHPLRTLYRMSQEPTTKSYALVPRYSSPLARAMDELFPTPFMKDMDFALSPFFKRMDDEMNQFKMQKSSPGHEINEDENKVELVLEVPGVKKEDINLEIRGERKVLHISGKRMVKEENSEIQSKFEKSFILGTLLDSSKIAATLDNGVLTIVAPKVPVPEEKVQKIEIFQK